MDKGIGGKAERMRETRRKLRLGKIGKSASGRELLPPTLLPITP